MIKANELRLGNLLYLYAENNVVEVIKILEAHLEVHSTDLQFWTEEIAEFNPIPLTEEILLKCGYEYEGDETGLYLGNDWSLSENAEGGFEVIINHEYWTTIQVEYVHELQNAIWALSSFKKELEVNL